MEEVISVLQTENTTSRTLLEMNSDMKKVHNAKYNKKKSGSNGCKPKNSIPQSSGQPSTPQKSNSSSRQICFHCKKPYSKGHAAPTPIRKAVSLDRTFGV